MHPLLLEGPVAESTRVHQDLFALYLAIALVVAGVVLAWLLWVLVAYRARPGAPTPRDAPVIDAPPKERGRGLWAYAMAGVISVILFATAFSTIHAIDFLDHPPEDGRLRIHVTGFQFGWIFTYPDNFTSFNDLVVPEDTVVVLDVTSRDVMHKFQISAFEIGIDAIPGQLNTIWFRADQPGVVQAWCAELCGIQGHHLMRATVTVLDQAAFQAWAATMRNPAESVRAHRELMVDLRDGSADPPTLSATAGLDIHLEVRNHGSAPVTWTVDAPAQGTTPPIAPGAVAWINFTTDPAWIPAGSSELTLSHGAQDAGQRATGLVASIMLARPRTIEVGLHEWGVDLDPATLAAGEPSLLRVTNAGRAPHDLTVGAWADDEGDRRVEWRTPLLDPDGTHDLLILPGQPGTLDLWCNVPGHHQLGMYATIEVTPP